MNSFSGYSNYFYPTNSQVLQQSFNSNGQPQPVYNNNSNFNNNYNNNNNNMVYQQQHPSNYYYQQPPNYIVQPQAQFYNQNSYQQQLPHQVSILQPHSSVQSGLPNSVCNLEYQMPVNQNNATSHASLPKETLSCSNQIKENLTLENNLINDIIDAQNQIDAQTNVECVPSSKINHKDDILDQMNKEV